MTKQNFIVHVKAFFVTFVTQITIAFAFAFLQVIAKDLPGWISYLSQLAGGTLAAASVYSHNS